MKCLSSTFLAAQSWKTGHNLTFDAVYFMNLLNNKMVQLNAIYTSYI